jgi:hypothetical protein
MQRHQASNSCFVTCMPKLHVSVCLIYAPLLNYFTLERAKKRCSVRTRQIRARTGDGNGGRGRERKRERERMHSCERHRTFHTHHHLFAKTKGVRNTEMLEIFREWWPTGAAQSLECHEQINNSKKQHQKNDYCVSVMLLGGVYLDTRTVTCAHSTCCKPENFKCDQGLTCKCSHRPQKGLALHHQPMVKVPQARSLSLKTVCLSVCLPFYNTFFNPRSNSVVAEAF